jgi:hypothetical protein
MRIWSATHSSQGAYINGLQIQRSLFRVRFKVLNAINIKITVFWDVTPCSVVENYCTNTSEEPTSSKVSSGKKSGKITFLSFRTG